MYIITNDPLTTCFVPIVSKSDIWDLLLPIENFFDLVFFCLYDVILSGDCINNIKNYDIDANTAKTNQYDQFCQYFDWSFNTIWNAELL